MSDWMRRIRGTVGMGVTWAAGWAVGGVLIGVMSDILPGRLWSAFFEIFDAPLPALAIPGFVGGVLFSLVLGVAARRDRLDELSLARFTAWGAFGGLMVSVTPAVLAAVGLLSRDGSTHGLWQVTAAISGPFVLLSALSAAGSLLLARRAERRDSTQALALTRARVDRCAAHSVLGSGAEARSAPASARPSEVVHPRRSVFGREP